MARISDENRDRLMPGNGYTILGAAKETGIPEVRIRRAVRAGEIETVKLGGTVRIPAREVRRLKELYK